jgi:hypothetical protein
MPSIGDASAIVGVNAASRLSGTAKAGAWEHGDGHGRRRSGLRGDTVEQVRADRGRRRAHLARVGVAVACALVLAGCVTASGGGGDRSSSSDGDGSSAAPALDGLPPERDEGAPSKAAPNGLPPERDEGSGAQPNGLPSEPDPGEDDEQARATADCREIVAMDWKITPGHVDLTREAISAAFPPVPTPGVPEAKVSDFVHWPNTQAYLDLIERSADEREVLAELMPNLGFRGGVDVTYLTRPNEHWVRVLRFANGPYALRFARHVLNRICEEVEFATPLDGDDDGPTRGVIVGRPDGSQETTFILGDSMVRLGVCECIAHQDPGVLEQWHDLVVDRYGEGPPTA